MYNQTINDLRLEREEELEFRDTLRRQTKVWTPILSRAYQVSGAKVKTISQIFNAYALLMYREGRSFHL